VLSWQVLYRRDFNFTFSVIFVKVTKAIQDMCAVCLMFSATKYQQGDVTVAKYANISLKKQK
jgi:hypothetical protein